MKAHFKQKSGTELYQELSVMHQGGSESPQVFLVRALNLKQGYKMKQLEPSCARYWK